jgi:hypothetical protein
LVLSIATLDFRKDSASVPALDSVRRETLFAETLDVGKISQELILENFLVVITSRHQSSQSRRLKVVSGDG